MHDADEPPWIYTLLIKSPIEISAYLFHLFIFLCTSDCYQLQLVEPLKVLFYYRDNCGISFKEKSLVSFAYFLSSYINKKKTI